MSGSSDGPSRRSGPTLELMIVQLSHGYFALPLADVLEALHRLDLVRPPTAPALVVGLFELDGRAVPVVDLHLLLGGTAPSAGLYDTILVMRDGGYAVLVDRVAGLWRGAPQDVLPLAAEQTLNGCVSARVATAWGEICVLDAARLLLAQERQRLTALQLEMHTRLHALQTETGDVLAQS